MNEKNFSELPAEIQTQINSLLAEGGISIHDDTREKYATIWKTKFNLFTGQISNVGMEVIKKLDKADPRGAILLTYSGSLISISPAQNGKRKLEYASIKFRSDVPDYIKGQGITLESDIIQDSIAEFGGSPLKQSSALYRIAVCPDGTSDNDQENRIREAMIYLTNGFMKINRTAIDSGDSGVDQFNMKSIVSFIAKKHGMTQTATRDLLDDYLSMLEAGILLGERVIVGKLGAAHLKTQAARKARVMKNLKTGADILVPAKPECLVPKFAFAKSLKEKSLAVDPELISKTGSDDDQEDTDE